MEVQNYNVEFEEFTKRHFIKLFEKKYKSAWVKTQNDIIDVCKRIDAMLEYKRADLIASVDCHKLVKLDFAVEGTQTSPKQSGNRCILHVNEDARFVRILIVYSKNEISDPNETVKWKQLVKRQFDDVAAIFNL